MRWNDLSDDTQTRLTFEKNGPHGAASADNRLNYVAKFTHYGTNSAREDGLAFILTILGGGITVEGVVWLTTGNAYVVTEDEIHLDEAVQQWLRILAMQAHPIAQASLSGT